VKRVAGVALSAFVLTVSSLAVGWSASPAYADGIRDQEWHLDFIHAGDAQQHTRGAGVIVAVVDRGVDGDHVDLAASVLPPVAVDGNTDAARFDPDGHGTALAGLIAGRGHTAGGSGEPDGSDGVLGVAPDAKVLPVVISNARSPEPSASASASASATPGTGTDGTQVDADQLADGIDLAVKQGATVICVGYSVAGDGRLEASVAAALRAGAIVVAADGNRAGEQPQPDPAGYAGVLAAVPVGRDGGVTVSSPSGRRLGIAVPGEDIMTTNAGGGYRVDAGSASPGILAGAVALVRAAHPDLPAEEIVHRITATAVDLDQPGPDAETGYGRLDLVAAVTRSVPLLHPATPSAAPSISRSAAPAAAAPLKPRGPWSWLLALPLLAVLGVLVVIALRAERRIVPTNPDSEPEVSSLTG
jgi:hypothetical protein